METTGEARERLQDSDEEDRVHIVQDEDGEADYNADTAVSREQHKSGKDSFLVLLLFVAKLDALVTAPIIKSARAIKHPRRGYKI